VGSGYEWVVEAIPLQAFEAIEKLLIATDHPSDMVAAMGTVVYFSTLCRMA
jgi:hypothetical protein